MPARDNLDAIVQAMRAYLGESQKIGMAMVSEETTHAILSDDVEKLRALREGRERDTRIH
jgi:hypothetical protein